MLSCLRQIARFHSFKRCTSVCLFVQRARIKKKTVQENNARDSDDDMDDIKNIIFSLLMFVANCVCVCDFKLPDCLPHTFNGYYACN